MAAWFHAEREKEGFTSDADETAEPVEMSYFGPDLRPSKLVARLIRAGWKAPPPKPNPTIVDPSTLQHANEVLKHRANHVIDSDAYVLPPHTCTRATTFDVLTCACARGMDR